jgi:acyl-CoA thioesterase FadM
MNVQYLKPVPLGQPLTVSGWEQKVEGREHTNVAEISSEQGEVLARSTGVFVAVDIAKMFARHLNTDQVVKRESARGQKESNA